MGQKVGTAAAGLAAGGIMYEVRMPSGQCADAWIKRQYEGRSSAKVYMIHVLINIKSSVAHMPAKRLRCARLVYAQTPRLLCCLCTARAARVLVGHARD